MEKEKAPKQAYSVDYTGGGDSTCPTCGRLAHYNPESPVPYIHFATAPLMSSTHAAHLPVDACGPTELYRDGKRFIAWDSLPEATQAMGEQISGLREVLEGLRFDQHQLLDLIGGGLTIQVGAGSKERKRVVQLMSPRPDATDSEE